MMSNNEEKTSQLDSKPAGGKFELYEDSVGQWRFRLKAANGEIIAVSEGYSSKDGARRGIDSVRKNAQTTRVDEV